ncbi:MAG: tRNA 2-thiocytidine biosynthesis TtcA family protein [Culturomica sp.]|jgi:tRNA(Ile)-lysidine synthase TilS/MesJ|nr:tRNA 2-thiocytidine biosynthesis TtcA family protein [Culturomica sp.]
MNELKMDRSKEEKLFYRSFFRKVGKAIFDYGMIENGDNVLVGVSGGKDSLSLLEVLAMRGKDAKYNYTLKAAHIAVENVLYEVDREYIEGLCRRLGVELIHRTISAEVRKDSDKPACFVCSWNRRKALFEIARETGCNKLALGHHRDDAVESLLMSMMFNARIASMPAKLSMFSGDLTLIRPLIYLTNEETLRYSDYRNFKRQKTTCPYEHATNRRAVQEVIEFMEKLSPQVRSNLFGSMRRVDKEYLL